MNFENYDYVIMNNRPVFKENGKSISCYKKFKNESIVDIVRNNQILSSFRKTN